MEVTFCAMAVLLYGNLYFSKKFMGEKSAHLLCRNIFMAEMRRT